MSVKYGQYCINKSQSASVLSENIKFFTFYQFKNNHRLRIDAMLIKPIQRLTR